MNPTTCPICATLLPELACECVGCGRTILPASGDAVTILPAGHPRTSASLVQLSSRFRDRYQLGRLLGVGAMGAVFLATDRQTEREVAIKLLVTLENGDILERFMREGRLLARIRHKNVVRVYDLDQLDGFPYMAMEFLSGGTLRERTRNGPIAPAEAIGLALDCLDGLAACHEVGIVHRDMKPDNLLFNTAGTLHVADLGIARDTSVDPLTRPGLVIGTPRYMAPEQVQGVPVGPTADLYAVGMILTELLLGRPMLAETSLEEILVAKLTAPAPKVNQLLPNIPPSLASILDRSLATSPADRPQSAREFAESLRGVGHTTPPKRQQIVKTVNLPEPRTSIRVYVIVALFSGLLRLVTVSASELASHERSPTVASGTRAVARLYTERLRGLTSTERRKLRERLERAQVPFPGVLSGRAAHLESALHPLEETQNTDRNRIDQLRLQFLIEASGENNDRLRACILTGDWRAARTLLEKAPAGRAMLAVVLDHLGEFTASIAVAREALLDDTLPEDVWRVLFHHSHLARAVARAMRDLIDGMEWGDPAAPGHFTTKLVRLMGDGMPPTASGFVVVSP